MIPALKLALDDSIWPVAVNTLPVIMPDNLDFVDVNFFLTVKRYGLILRKRKVKVKLEIF